MVDWLGLGLNPHVKMEDSPFVLVFRKEEWEMCKRGLKHCTSGGIETPEAFCGPSFRLFSAEEFLCPSLSFHHYIYLEMETFLNDYVEGSIYSFHQDLRKNASRRVSLMSLSSRSKGDLLGLQDLSTFAVVWSGLATLSPIVRNEHGSLRVACGVKGRHSLFKGSFATVGLHPEWACVSTGTWYYEVSVEEGVKGKFQVGWAMRGSFFPSSSEGIGVGDAGFSYSWDGGRCLLFRRGVCQNAPDVQWETGSKIGCLLEIEESGVENTHARLFFSLNGKWVTHEPLFDEIVPGKPAFVPCVSMTAGNECTIHVQQNPSWNAHGAHSLLDLLMIDPQTPSLDQDGSPSTVRTDGEKEKQKEKQKEEDGIDDEETFQATAMKGNQWAFKPVDDLISWQEKTNLDRHIDKVVLHCRGRGIVSELFGSEYIYSDAVATTLFLVNRIHFVPTYMRETQVWIRDQPIYDHAQGVFLMAPHMVSIALETIYSFADLELLTTKECSVASLGSTTGYEVTCLAVLMQLFAGVAIESWSYVDDERNLIMSNTCVETLLSQLRQEKKDGKIWMKSDDVVGQTDVTIPISFELQSNMKETLPQNICMFVCWREVDDEEIQTLQYLVARGKKGKRGILALQGGAMFLWIACIEDRDVGKHDDCKYDDDGDLGTVLWTKRFVCSYSPPLATTDGRIIGASDEVEMSLPLDFKEDSELLSLTKWIKSCRSADLETKHRAIGVVKNLARAGFSLSIISRFGLTEEDLDLCKIRSLAVRKLLLEQSSMLQKGSADLCCKRAGTSASRILEFDRLAPDLVLDSRDGKVYRVTFILDGDRFKKHVLLSKQLGSRYVHKLFEGFENCDGEGTHMLVHELSGSTLLDYCAAQILERQQYLAIVIRLCEILRCLHDNGVFLLGKFRIQDFAFFPMEYSHFFAVDDPPPRRSGFDEEWNVEDEADNLKYCGIFPQDVVVIASEKDEGLDLSQVNKFISEDIRQLSAIIAELFGAYVMVAPSQPGVLSSPTPPARGILQSSIWDSDLREFVRRLASLGRIVEDFPFHLELYANVGSGDEFSVVYDVFKTQALVRTVAPMWYPSSFIVLPQRDFHLTLRHKREDLCMHPLCEFPLSHLVAKCDEVESTKGCYCPVEVDMLAALRPVLCWTLEKRCHLIGHLMSIPHVIDLHRVLGDALGLDYDRTRSLRQLSFSASLESDWLAGLGPSTLEGSKSPTEGHSGMFPTLPILFTCRDEVLLFFIRNSIPRLRGKALQTEMRVTGEYTEGLPLKRLFPVVVLKSARAASLPLSEGDFLWVCKEHHDLIERWNRSEWKDDTHSHFRVLAMDISQKFSLPHSVWRLHKSGFLKKLGHRFKTWKKRWFVLSGLEMKYFGDRDPMNPECGIELKGTISLSAGSQAWICNAKKGHCFEVFTPTKSFLIQAHSEEERDAWMEAINSAIKTHTFAQTT
eukprot:TRINITY_DN45974_c0_g1_i4.p1 TRINITY_DN45974_c0_g1~~TRINITY_DN45974_c0_g1_i4.p1  ORF type:complete len:1442 (-),score=328.72 TRINITY_DN45974_c0_g1_i4:1052-5377(-)